MPAFGSMLSGADITNLAKFLKGEAVAPPPPGSTPAPLPEMTPKELYISNCATCHGADRRGGRGPALLGKRVEKARDVARTMVRGEDGMPSFAGNLTTQQIIDLARWLTSTPFGTLSDR
jgi:mono/diheme cytochrome c family protein